MFYSKRSYTSMCVWYGEGSLLYRINAVWSDWILYQHKFSFHGRVWSTILICSRNNWSHSRNYRDSFLLEVPMKKEYMVYVCLLLREMDSSRLCFSCPNNLMIHLLWMIEDETWRWGLCEEMWHLPRDDAFVDLSDILASWVLHGLHPLLLQNINQEWLSWS